MIKVLLSDDHGLFREGIHSMIEKENDISVVGEAEDGVALIEKYYQLSPDIIISDISMPRKNGPDAVRSLTKKNKDVKALFLSQFTGDDYIYSVLDAGGKGLVSKNVLKSELLQAIRTVAEGKKYFMGKTESELEAISNRYNILKKTGKKENIDILTKREKEILLLVGKNLSSREIADQLNVSVRTVDTHRMRIISKFKLKSLPGLIGFARDYCRQNQSKF